MDQSCERMRDRSNATFSCSVQLADCTMPPSIWFLMPSGLTAWPLSAADTAREWHAYFTTWTAWNHVRTVTAFAAAALMQGGHMRVGLEDNLRVTGGRRAGSNAELVEKAIALAALLDREPADAGAARGLLGLAGA